MALGMAVAEAVAGIASADAAILIGGAEVEAADLAFDAGAVDTAAVHLAPGQWRRALDRVGQGRAGAAAELAAQREDRRRTDRQAQFGALAGDRVAIAFEPPRRPFEQTGALGVDDR